MPDSIQQPIIAVPDQLIDRAAEVSDGELHRAFVADSSFVAMQVPIQPILLQEAPIDTVNFNLFHQPYISIAPTAFGVFEGVSADTVRQMMVHPSEIFGTQSVLETTTFTPSQKLVKASEWPSMFASGVMVLAILLIYYSQDYIQYLYQSLLRSSISNKEFRENSAVKKQYSTQYFWFSLFTTSALVLSLLAYWHPVIRFTPPFLGIVGLCIAGCWLIQDACNALIGTISMHEMLFRELKFTKKMLLGGVGILSLPITLFLLLHYQTHSSTSFFLLITFFSLVLIYMSYRSLAVFYRSNVSIFFWFLYLCIFELGPYFVLYIVFQHNTNF